MVTSHRSPFLPIPYRWVWFIGTIYAFLFVSQAYLGYLSRHPQDPFGWFFIVTTMVTHYLTWILLVPLIYRLSRFQPERPVLAPSRVGFHLGAGLLVASVQSVVSVGLRSAAFRMKDGQWINIFDAHGMATMAGGIFSALVEYLVLVGAFVAIDTYRKYRERELELVRMENALNNAELQALKMQLHPHFLFNTLHSISSLMNENIEGAQRVVTRLGFLLRKILESDARIETTLDEELSYVRSYLDIEEVRFADRLRVEYDIHDATRGCIVPSLILQPLVENAIKHGFSKQRDGGLIRVASDLADGMVTLIVSDDGRGSDNPARALDRPGVGLRNTQTRLSQMYGSRGGLSVESRPGGGFVARITVPCRKPRDTP